MLLRPRMPHPLVPEWPGRRASARRAMAAVFPMGTVTAFLLQGIPLRMVKQLPSKEIKLSHRTRLNVGTVPRTSACL